MKSFYILNSRILSHIIFWFTILFMYTFFPYLYKGGFWEILKTNLLYLPQDIIAVYFVLYILFPKYLIKFKFTQFILLSFFSILFLTSLSILVTNYILPSLHLYHTEASIKKQFSDSMFVLLSITGMAATIKYVRLNLITQFQKADIAMKQMETELKYLRSQINPHFLFNSLNNIDELIFEDKEIASKAIFQLSEILRYVLKESELYKTSLNHEIDFIKNYIDFIRLSFKDKDFVNFQIKGNIGNINIPPLLFLPIIENAVKYADRKSEIPGISISIILYPDNLEFETNNRFIKNDFREDGNGIGLRNLKRRLDLMYPDTHSLKILSEDGKFTVNLKLFGL